MKLTADRIKKLYEVYDCLYELRRLGSLTKAELQEIYDQLNHIVYIKDDDRFQLDSYLNVSSVEHQQRRSYQSKTWNAISGLHVGLCMFQGLLSLHLEDGPSSGDSGAFSDTRAMFTMAIFLNFTTYCMLRRALSFSPEPLLRQITNQLNNMFYDLPLYSKGHNSYRVKWEDSVAVLGSVRPLMRSFIISVFERNAFTVTATNFQKNIVVFRAWSLSYEEQQTMREQLITANQILQQAKNICSVLNNDPFKRVGGAAIDYFGFSDEGIKVTLIIQQKNSFDLKELFTEKAQAFIHLQEVGDLELVITGNNFYQFPGIFVDETKLPATNRRHVSPQLPRDLKPEVDLVTQFSVDEELQECESSRTLQQQESIAYEKAKIEPLRTVKSRLHPYRYMRPAKEAPPQPVAVWRNPHNPKQLLPIFHHKEGNNVENVLVYIKSGLIDGQPAEFYGLFPRQTKDLIGDSGGVRDFCKSFNEGGQGKFTLEHKHYVLKIRGMSKDSNARVISNEYWDTRDADGMPHRLVIFDIFDKNFHNHPNLKQYLGAEPIPKAAYCSPEDYAKQHDKKTHSAGRLDSGVRLHSAGPAL